MPPDMIRRRPLTERIRYIARQAEKKNADPVVIALLLHGLADELDYPAVANPWIPLSADGLPPVTYPAWRKQETERRSG